MSSGRIQRGSRAAAQGRNRRSKGAKRKFGSRSASTPFLRSSPSPIGPFSLTTRSSPPRVLSPGAPNFYDLMTEPLFDNGTGGAPPDSYQPRLLRELSDGDQVA